MLEKAQMTVIRDEYTTTKLVLEDLRLTRKATDDISCTPTDNSTFNNININNTDTSSGSNSSSSSSSSISGGSGSSTRQLLSRTNSEETFESCPPPGQHANVHRSIRDTLLYHLDQRHNVVRQSVPGCPGAYFM